MTQINFSLQNLLKKCIINHRKYEFYIVVTFKIKFKGSEDSKDTELFSN